MPHMFAVRPIIGLNQVYKCIRHTICTNVLSEHQYKYIGQTNCTKVLDSAGAQIYWPNQVYKCIDTTRCTN